MAPLAASVAFWLAVAAMAEPRIAVHPLELGAFTAEERETLRAQFEVLVARVPHVQLAGSSRIDETLAKAAASGCEVRDGCLRFLAESTDSLYGLYVRLDGAPLGIVATARVVRTDGVTVRKLRIEAATARDALVQTIAELNLTELASDLPMPVAELTPPPTPAAEPQVWTRVLQPQPPTDWKKVAGWSLVGVGAATFVTGSVFAALAASSAAANPPNASGLVTADRAPGAANALRQSNIAAVLMPAGAALSVVGAIVVLVPSASERNAVSLAVTPINGGLAASMSGALP